MHLNVQPLVTVLTPVYNGEKYLAECIESVLAQTYKNWEYVIVNNCSTDSTLDIAQYYAEKDIRIRIHNNKEFLGSIQNHNNAIRQISSESKYCKMLHADDLLLPECIMQMVSVALANPSVGVVGSYFIGSNWYANIIPYPTTVISGREICRKCLCSYSYTNKDVFGTPTTTLIRSDLIRGRVAFYNENHLGADKEAMYVVLQSSDFGFVHQVLSYSRVHPGQVTVSNARGTGLLSKIFIIENHGHAYLNTKEKEYLLKKVWKNYYRVLAKNLLIEWRKVYIDVYKSKAENLGFSFSSAKLLQAVLVEIIDNVLNPKRTMEKVISHILKNQKTHNGNF